MLKKYLVRLITRSPAPWFQWHSSAPVGQSRAHPRIPKMTVEPAGRPIKGCITSGDAGTCITKTNEDNVIQHRVLCDQPTSCDPNMHTQLFPRERTVRPQSSQNPFISPSHLCCCMPLNHPPTATIFCFLPQFQRPRAPPSLSQLREVDHLSETEASPFIYCGTW